MSLLQNLVSVEILFSLENDNEDSIFFGFIFWCFVQKKIFYILCFYILCKTEGNGFLPTSWVCKIYRKCFSFSKLKSEENIKYGMTENCAPSETIFIFHGRFSAQATKIPWQYLDFPGTVNNFFCLNLSKILLSVFIFLINLFEFYYYIHRRVLSLCILFIGDSCIQFNWS